MYKVFFNDRKVFLTDDFSKHFQIRYGLFYKYRDREDLHELITFYQHLSKIDSLYIFHSDVEELRNAFKSCFIPLKAAGGLIRNQKDEFLLIYRRGKWDLPKGKLNNGETFENAALREVEEECGIAGMQIIKPLISTYHTYPYKDGTALKRTSWYEMLYKGSGEPQPQTEEDIEEIRWVSKDKLDYYLKNSFPAVGDVFRYYGVNS
jgi:8-oxo-dGTP pyrophosphatase MutT (NUDIX family)